MNVWKKLMAAVLTGVMLLSCGLCAQAEEGFTFNWDSDTNQGPHCKSIFMLNLDTDTVVYTHNPDEPLPMASMTKIMTYIVAYENIPDLENTVITVPQSVETELLGTGSSLAGVQVGEELTAHTLLYLMMVPSGNDAALTLMKYVDDINMAYGGEGTKLYSTAGTKFKKLCLQNKLNLLDASVRHLGTDINYVVLKNLYDHMKDHIDFYFDTPVNKLEKTEDGYRVICEKDVYECERCIVSVGRSGSKWMEKVCKEMKIPTKSNRVDIGVRVELPAVIFSHLTDELYESKIVYRTEKFEDNVRTFCMNPNGIVVNENTNGIITVNGHSYEGDERKTENTNFALLVSKHFSEPFKDSNGYGESIARLSNMLGGGVIVQRFGDLVRGRRSTVKRVEEGLVRPTLLATPGDLSLVLPKRILDGIIEMIYALDKVAPGTANDDTLLYGVEVKFYNMEVEIDENLESYYKGLYIIGDGSGVTHSLSHASASGIYVARHIAAQ